MRQLVKSETGANRLRPLCARYASFWRRGMGIYGVHRTLLGRARQMTPPTLTLVPGGKPVRAYPNPDHRGLQVSHLYARWLVLVSCSSHGIRGRTRTRLPRLGTAGQNAPSYTPTASLNCLRRPQGIQTNSYTALGTARRGVGTPRARETLHGPVFASCGVRT